MGSTLGGNPLAMSVGNKVFDIISNKIKDNSEYFHRKLDFLKKTYPNVIEEIRGRGFLIGLKIKVNQIEFIERLMLNKLLTIRAAENVIRILPPLNVNKKKLI